MESAVDLPESDKKNVFLLSNNKNCFMIANHGYPGNAYENDPSVGAVERWLLFMPLF
jgi:hypothetical protein